MTLSRMALAAVLTLAAGLAQAGTLKVSPIKVTVPSDGRSEVIRVKNPDGKAALVLGCAKTFQEFGIFWTELGFIGFGSGLTAFHDFRRHSLPQGRQVDDIGSHALLWP